MSYLAEQIDITVGEEIPRGALNYSFIYRIISPTNKIYIGQTRNINSRKSKYRNIKCKEQPIIYKSLLKYGFDKHNFKIIEKFDKI